MIIDERHHDVIVIGSGAGGGTLAGELAAAGRSVLLLERGEALALSDQNVADIDLFRRRRYHPEEPWFGTDGDPFAPQTVQAWGGNTKIWGGVLQRMRAPEFAGLQLLEGSTPAWPIRYDELAPWYDRAEALYRVHGEAGADPTEPARSGPYPHAPRPIEPFLAELGQAYRRSGLHPYVLPQSWSESAVDPTGDAELFGVERAAAAPGFERRGGVRVEALHTDPSGRRVLGVEGSIAGQRWLFRAHQVVLAAGAIHTPVILLRSASEAHPRGLANGSDQVGRHLMKLQLTAILQRASQPNSGRYGRSFGFTDHYWGDRNVSVPLGAIQSGGGVLQDPLFAESPPLLSLVTRLLPDRALEWLADRSITWWAMSTVRPDPDNRVQLRDGRISVAYLANNREAHDRLVYRWLACMNQVEDDPLTQVVMRTPIVPRGEAPESVVGYACGSCRMGADPADSVVDGEGRCHGIENLWIADASVLPTASAVGSGLTVIALALRLAARLQAELG
ncbi:MAG: GMC family oxidoreductase [Cyanobacteriota bacterium]|nr:GMC family oxidoreductase [Cyanobacteriota bacterium]